MSHSQKKRAAFFLNTNAKSVTKGLLKRLRSLIPSRDMYLSRSLIEAKESMDAILAQNYTYVFCGGGDGTIISAINLLNGYQKLHRYQQLPKIGVLRLGTGNALARYLKANAPEADVRAILAGKAIKPVDVSMIETNSGQQTPFAGIGYDGELINDFESIKEVFFDSPFRKLFSSAFGFFIAGALKTLPRQLARELPSVRINSSYPAYRITEENGVDVETYLPEGQILYEGAAPMICVGTIPSVGYNLTLFPFANRRPGYMHLRISAVPISVFLSNFYPAIWHGHFRHKKLFDFLVKDVSIESDESLPYQLGGDAMGYKKQLYFKISKNPVSMASLHMQSKRITIPSEPLMTPV